MRDSIKSGRWILSKLFFNHFSAVIQKIADLIAFIICEFLARRQIKLVEGFAEVVRNYKKFTLFSSWLGYQGNFTSDCYIKNSVSVPCLHNKGMTLEQKRQQNVIEICYFLLKCFLYASSGNCYAISFIGSIEEVFPWN